MGRRIYVRDDDLLKQLMPRPRDHAPQAIPLAGLLLVFNLNFPAKMAQSNLAHTLQGQAAQVQILPGPLSALSF